MRIGRSGAAVLPVLAAMFGMAAALLTGTAAQAQTDASWVSGAGNDSNACTRTSPCRTFAGVLGRAAAAGSTVTEINCLDAGKYGSATISGAIIINCPGGIVPTLTINAEPNDIVVVDGLELRGADTLNGIIFKSGASLIIRNSVIRNYRRAGIYFAPNLNARLALDNTVISATGLAAGSTGAIDIYPGSAASVRVSVSRTVISDNAIGVNVFGFSTTGSIFVSIRSSTIVNNRVGVVTDNGIATSVTVALDDVGVSGSSAQGLYANGQRAGMLVNNSTITNNIDGGVVAVNGAVIYSYGNNRVNGNNAKDGSFTATLSQR